MSPGETDGRERDGQIESAPASDVNRRPWDSVRLHHLVLREERSISTGSPHEMEVFRIVQEAAGEICVSAKFASGGFATALGKRERD